jgi:hypothetical protein
MYTVTVIALESTSGPSTTSTELLTLVEIDRLSLLRSSYSRAHEVAHEALATDPATGAHLRVLLDTLIKSEESVRSFPLDWMKGYSTASVLPSRLLHLPGIHDSGPRLPTWCTSDSAGMPAGTWLHKGTQTEPMATPARTAPPRVRVLYCLPVSADSAIIDSWASIVRLLDRVLAALHLMRMRVRVGIRHHPNALTFVLVMLAACRHYAKRSEPDDHASLVIRRHLVSMGSCPQT